MRCIIRRSKLFHRVEASEVKATDAAGNEVQAEVHKRHFAAASNNQQEIPNWCKETLTYKVGVKDNSIVETAQTTAAPLPAEVTEAGKKPDDPPVPPVDSGLTPNDPPDDGNGKKKKS